MINYSAVCSTLMTELWIWLLYGFTNANTELFTRSNWHCISAKHWPVAAAEDDDDDDDPLDGCCCCCCWIDRWTELLLWPVSLILLQFVEAIGNAADPGDSGSGLGQKLLGFVKVCVCFWWEKEEKRLVSTSIRPFAGRKAGTDIGRVVGIDDGWTVRLSTILIPSVSIAALDMLAVGDGDEIASGEL